MGSLVYYRNSEVKNYKFIKTENILTKTKSKMISLQSSTFICVVLIAFCSIARSDESGHNVDATSDYYAQYYQDFYNNLAAKDAGERDSGYVEPAETYAEPSYGLTESMKDLDPALILGAIGAVMGTLAAIGVVINNNDVNSLSEDQDSICTSTKALGNTVISTSPYTATPTHTTANAAFNTLANAINNIATPSC